jgi:hypothetical protein
MACTVAQENNASIAYLHNLLYIFFSFFCFLTIGYQWQGTRKNDRVREHSVRNHIGRHWDDLYRIPRGKHGSSTPVGEITGSAVATVRDDKSHALGASQVDGQ